MAAQAKGSTNWFAIWISIAVVVVLVGVAALVVVMNRQATAPGAIPDSIAVEQETGAIVMGDVDSDSTMQVYLDFMCPHCAEFEKAFGKELAGLAADGDLRYEVLPVSIMDRATETEYSTRAANSLYCVAEENSEATIPFMLEMFQNQRSGGLSDEQIIEIAGNNGAEGAADCITGRDYEQLVQFTTQNLPENPQTGSRGTPTVVWDDEYVQLADFEGRLKEFTSGLASSQG